MIKWTFSSSATATLWGDTDTGDLPIGKGSQWFPANHEKLGDGQRTNAHSCPSEGTNTQGTLNRHVISEGGEAIACCLQHPICGILLTIVLASCFGNSIISPSLTVYVWKGGVINKYTQQEWKYPWNDHGLNDDYYS